MTSVLITPATEQAVALADVKAHLRVDFTDDDTMIGAMLGAATNLVEKWLGRALRPQTWEYRLDAFPSDEIALPYAPLIEIVSIKYDDADGVEQTMSGSDYRIYVDGSESGVMPAYDGTWPSARADVGAVRIRYTAGYEETEDGDPLPYAIKAALLLMIGDLYAGRETFTADAAVRVPMAPTVDALLGPYRQIIL